MPREGFWFAVPLEQGEFALGLVARASEDNSTALGYFFGPKRAEPPTLADAQRYHADDAILVKIIDTDALADGRWPLLGAPHALDRRLWPMPDFGQDIPGQLYRVRFPDGDLDAAPTYVPVGDDEYKRLPRFGYSPPVAVQRTLSRLLAGDAQPGQGEQLRQGQGSGRATIRHFLYFPTQATAMATARELEARGFAVTVRRSDAGNPDDLAWLALALHPRPGTPEDLDELETLMESVATSAGGEYDGYKRDARHPSV